MALIYIVEDDENIREIETIALKNSNYMVCAFEKAKDFYKTQMMMPTKAHIPNRVASNTGCRMLMRCQSEVMMIPASVKCKIGRASCRERV